MCIRDSSVGSAGRIGSDVAFVCTEGSQGHHAVGFVVGEAGPVSYTHLEGVIRAAVAPCGCSGIILELNCETDFCAKGDKFQGLVNDVCLLYTSCGK